MSQPAMNGMSGPMGASSPSTSASFYGSGGPQPYSNQPYQHQLAHHHQQYPHPPPPPQQLAQQPPYGGPPVAGGYVQQQRARPPPPPAPPPPKAHYPPNGHTDNQRQPQPPQRMTPDGWEGGSMLDLYIADYLAKRGYLQASQQVINEAGLGAENKVPIDAPQGLLYEWWSVFWELFTATGGPHQAKNAVVPHSMDAALYVQAQAQAQGQAQASNPSHPTHPNPTSQPGPAGHRPPMAAAASHPPPPRSNLTPFAPPLHGSQQSQDGQLAFKQPGPRPGQPQGQPQYHPDGRPVLPGGYNPQPPPQIQMQSPSPNGMVGSQPGSAAAGPTTDSYGYMIDQSQSQQHLQSNHPPQVAVSQPRPQPPQPNQMQLQQQAHLPPGAGQQQPILHPYDALGLPGPLEQNVVMGLLTQMGLAGRDLTRLTAEEKQQVQQRYPHFLAQHQYQQQSGQMPRIASQNRQRPTPPQNGMTAVEAQRQQAQQQMALATQHQMQNHHMPVNPQKRSNSPPPDGANGGPTGNKRAKKSPPGPAGHTAQLQEQHRQQMLQQQQQQQQGRPMYLAPSTNSPIAQSPSQYTSMGDPQQQQPQFSFNDHPQRDGRQSPAIAQMANGGGPAGRPMLKRKQSKADARANGNLPPPPSAPSPLSQAGTPNASAMPPPSTPGPSANGQRTNPQTPKDAPPPSPANSVGGNAAHRARPPTPLATSMVASPHQYSQQFAPPRGGQPPVNGASPSAYNPPPTSNSTSRPPTPAANNNTAPSPHYNQQQPPPPSFQQQQQQQQQPNPSAPSHSASDKAQALAPPPVIRATIEPGPAVDPLLDFDVDSFGDWGANGGMLMPFDEDVVGDDLSGFDFEQYMNLAGDGLVGGDE